MCTHEYKALHGMMSSTRYMPATTGNKARLKDKEYFYVYIPHSTYEGAFKFTENVYYKEVANFFCTKTNIFNYNLAEFLKYLPRLFFFLFNIF